jgi:hypothetical protein
MRQQRTRRVMWCLCVKYNDIPSPWLHGPLVDKPEGELMMHFRVFDLGAERCVWSIPPIDTVPWKLRELFARRQRSN